jgi:hypothetical protein
VFASVCINSNIIVNLVPIAEKYKILLWEIYIKVKNKNYCFSLMS